VAKSEVDLDELCARMALVRITRRIKKADRVDGFVVGLGEEWLLLHRVNEELLDGYTAVRRRDIRRVTQLGPDSFFVRAMEYFKQFPVRAAEIDLDSVLGVLGSLPADQLAVLFTERLHADECYIGRVDSCTKKSVRLREIDPEAKWHDEPTKYKLEDITLIEFGGRYEEALLALGGEPK
jgi:hypothetical protein